MLTGNGEIDGVAVLERSALDGAMQRVPSDRGLNADNLQLELHYNYGFWAEVYSGPSVGCGPGSYYQPYWSGYGGIRVVLMPNGATYYYFSDGGEFEMDAEIQESRKIGSLCRAATAEI